jgi:hypothetical protein
VKNDSDSIIQGETLEDRNDGPTWRRPVLTEIRNRALIGGGVEKLVEGLSTPSKTMDAICYSFCKVWVKYHRVPFSTIAPKILPMVTGI